jgi:alpha-L-fucosidase
MDRPGSLQDQKAAGKHMDQPAAASYRLAEFTYPILPEQKGGANWFYSLPEHDGLCHPAEKTYQDYLGAVPGCQSRHHTRAIATSLVSHDPG